MLWKLRTTSLALDFLDLSAFCLITSPNIVHRSVNTTLMFFIYAWSIVGEQNTTSEDKKSHLNSLCYMQYQIPDCRLTYDPSGADWPMIPRAQIDLWSLGCRLTYDPSGADWPMIPRAQIDLGCRLTYDPSGADWPMIPSAQIELWSLGCRLTYDPSGADWPMILRVRIDLWSLVRRLNYDPSVAH